MNVIPLAHLTFAFVPLAIVAIVLWRWSLGVGLLGHATLRMLLQLGLIGYVLTFLFDSNHPGLVAGVIAVMLCAASWIALRPLSGSRPGLYPRALLAIAGAGLFTLAVIVLGVLRPTPWFDARTLLPIAGMIFSNAMNSVSLAAERYEHAANGGASHVDARRQALETALIPLLNAFFAVGLVALPGMMTGQILAGVAPHVAVRYQIMVMCMTFGAAGLAAIGYLALVPRHTALDGDASPRPEGNERNARKAAFIRDK